MIIENKGKELFRKSSKLSAPKLEYSTRVWMRTGEISPYSGEAFVSFDYTSKYAKNANIKLTSNGEASYDKTFTGSEAKHKAFSWALPAFKSNYFELIANKDMENQYKVSYPIYMVKGAEVTYPVNYYEADDEYKDESKKDIDVKTAFGNLDENGNCVLTVTVNEPDAGSILIKVLDENNKVIGTTTKDQMLYADDAYTGAFTVRNNKTYRVDVTINAKSVSQKKSSKMIFVDVQPDKDGDGLYDNFARTVNGKIVAPQDPNPSEMSVPVGMWDKHIQQVENGNIATELNAFVLPTVLNDLYSTNKLDDVILANEIDCLIYAT